MPAMLLAGHQALRSDRQPTDAGAEPRGDSGHPVPAARSQGTVMATTRPPGVRGARRRLGRTGPEPVRASPRRAGPHRLRDLRVRGAAARRLAGVGRIAGRPEETSRWAAPFAGHGPPLRQGTDYGASSSSARRLAPEAAGVRGTASPDIPETDDPRRGAPWTSWPPASSTTRAPGPCYLDEPVDGYRPPPERLARSPRPPAAAAPCSPVDREELTRHARLTRRLARWSAPRPSGSVRDLLEAHEPLVVGFRATTVRVHLLRPTGRLGAPPPTCWPRSRPPPGAAGSPRP